MESATSKQVDLRAIEGQINSLFYKEWTEKLETKSVFKCDDTERIVTKENIGEVIKAIEIDQVVKQAEVLNILEFYQDQRAPFAIFYKELVKLMDKISDEDNIVSAYNTPAERIVKMLKVVKTKYLKDD